MKHNLGEMHPLILPQALAIVNVLIQEESTFHQALRVMYPEMDEAWKLASHSGKNPPKAVWEARDYFVQMFTELAKALAEPDKVYKEPPWML